MKDAKTIFKKLIKNLLLKLNKSLFLRSKYNRIEFNQDEIVVAIGIIINPISSK